MIVSSNDEFYKFYFENLPESNPESIELEFLGQDSIIVTDELLIVYMDNVGLTLKAPIVYQVNSNEVTTRLNWKPKFSLNSSGNIHLDIDNGIYDHNQSLIYMFDENLKAAGTYETKNLVKGRLEGGSKWDNYYDIDIYTPIDGTERPTVCGTTTSINFPTTYKYTGTKGGGNEVLVVCYDNTLNRRWSVVYGGTADDGYLTPYGISVDNYGNSYIAPEVRSNDIPLIDVAGSADYHDNTTSGSEILIARFDKDGFHTWATFFGGSGGADAGDIILNKSTNEFFVCGMEGGFPVVDPGSNAFPYGYSNQGSASNFIAKFNSSLGLVWSTGFGINNSNFRECEITSLEIDQNGKLLMTGNTPNSSNFPIKSLAGANNYSYSGGLYDAFVARFDNNLELEWCTYFGGSGKDKGNRIILNNLDEIVITGYTQTTSGFLFSAPSGSYSQSNFGGNGSNFFGDAFLTTFESNGTLKYSSYLGGQSGEEGFALTSFRKGLGYNIFTGGYTKSSNFPIPNNQSSLLYVENTHSNVNDTYEDAYIACFNKDVSLAWSTLIGGNSTIGGDGGDIILSADCYETNVYYIGNTSSQNFKPVNGFPNTYNGGVEDGFILKFEMEGTPLSVKEITNKSFSFFPNPSNTIINITFDSKVEQNMIKEALIYDVNGKLINKIDLKSSQYKIDVTNLPSGIYFAKFSGIESEIKDGMKFVVE